MKKITEYCDNFSDIRDIPYIEILDNRDSNLLFTFGIPTYRRSKTLHETIESILGQQTNIEFNILIVDNNPERNDETENLIYNKYSNIKNLTYIKNSKNLGLTGNWNRLFQLCQTKYMIMVHDDDYLLPIFMERISYFIDKLPSASVINCRKINWTGEKIDYQTKITNQVISHSAETNFAYHSFLQPTGCCFKVDEIINIGGFNPEYYPSLDYFLILKLALAKQKLYVINERLMLYRAVNNTSSLLETSIGWLTLEYEMRQQIFDKIKLPISIKKIIMKYETKFKVTSLKRKNKDFHFYNIKGGGFIFLFIFRLYRFLFNRMVVYSKHNIIKV